jgi:hypothetical protein
MNEAGSSMLLVPREHGAWAMLMIPFVSAVLVVGEWTPQVLTALVFVVFAFSARYSIEMLLIPASYSRAGRPDRGQVRRSAWNCSLVAAIAGFLLIVVWSLYQLLWVGLAAAFVFGLRIRQGRLGADRELRTEVTGAVGLTLTALVGWIASAGSVDKSALLLWALNCAFFCAAIVYVKARIRALSARRRGEKDPYAWRVFCFHLLVVAFVISLVFARWVSSLVVVPFALAALRAIMGQRARQRTFSLKRLGWSELVLSLVFAGFLVWGFSL